MKIRYDNTESVKHNAKANEIAINFVDAHVTPRQLIRIGKLPKVGETAYVLGMREGIFAEDVEGYNATNSVSVTFGKGNKASTRFVRADETKNTPWTPEDIAEHREHCEKESKRVEEETRLALIALEERLSLKKQFTGR